MVMAVGCLVLLPIAFVIGRRPVFIISVLICLICFITSGTSQTFSQHFISRIFVGLATGSVESLLPLIIADITYLDERGFYFGIYWSTQNCVSSGILIGLPYLVADAGWRWFYWLFVIMMAISFIFAFFLLPETRFAELPITLSGRTIHTDEFGHTAVMTNEEALQRFGHIDTDLRPPEPKRTYLQELKPWSPVAPHAFKVWLGAYVKIGKSFTSPAVIWALLLSSIALGTGIAISLVYSVVLEVQYKWSPSSVGLFNVGIIPASFLAMIYSGWFGDKMNLWLARGNNGIHRPEHQLVNLVFAGITGAIGLIAVALPANNPEKYSAWGMVIGEFTKTNFGLKSTVADTPSRLGHLPILFHLHNHHNDHLRSRGHPGKPRCSYGGCGGWKEPRFVRCFSGYHPYDCEVFIFDGLYDCKSSGSSERQI